MKKHLFAALFLASTLFGAVAPAEASGKEAMETLSALLSSGTEMVKEAYRDADLPTPQSLLDEWKESAKQEGRAYARELGDIMVERAVQDKKIAQALDSVRRLCYAVIAYLTGVTLLIIFLFCRIKTALNKLLRTARRGEA